MMLDVRTGLPDGLWPRFNHLSSGQTCQLSLRGRLVGGSSLTTSSCRAALTDLLPAGCRRVRGGASPAALLSVFSFLRVGSVHQSCPYHLQVSPPEHLQLQHPGQRGFEALPDADALAAGPERVHAAAASGHPPGRVGYRAAGDGGGRRLASSSG